MSFDKLNKGAEMKATNYMPEGKHTVTPYLVVRGADKAIEFYIKAFGAKELNRNTGPDGKTIMHAEIKIGDSAILLTEEAPHWGTNSPQSLGGVAGSLYLYVPNVDASYKQAVDAGCESKMAPADMFWGDRFAKLQDPFGHEWSLATHIEDLDAEEIKTRQTKFFAQMASAKA
jgi:PhnB protein